MSLSSDLSSRGRWPSLDNLVRADSVVGARVSAKTARTIAGAAIVPMVATTVWLALASDHLVWPLASALYRSCLTAVTMATGLYWWLRRPARRFGPLLVAVGIGTWIVSWQFSNWPLLFDVGVLAEGPLFVLIFYLFLAFPVGRVEPPAARWLLAVLALAVAAFFVPWALVSPVIAGAAPLTSCAPNCPPNVLQLGSAPKLVEVAGKAETYTALAITVAVFAVYSMRLRTASRPQRRALMAVALTSLPYLAAFFVLSFGAWILYLDPATLEVLAWVVVGARLLMPLGFLAALVQAELFAGRALGSLLERLAARPTPEQWRASVATALDDPALRLAFYDPGTRRFRESDGDELAPPRPGSGRAWVPVDRDGRPVAAMAVDEALAEDPELVRAAAWATLLAVENGALEGELRASQARILAARVAERRRIERNLHDSAQQRLVALRIHLAIAGERLDHEQERAMLERLGTEVDDALEELRMVAHGDAPQALADAGVGAALAGVARRSPMPIGIQDGWRGRHPEAVESTVYFCCVECLQNAAKHAGPGTSATIWLSESDDGVGFRVEDDGTGFDPGRVKRGAGLTNLAGRVAAAGGTLEIVARPGHGTSISGVLPVAAAGTAPTAR